MTQSIHVVGGRITRKGAGDGVHGLRVEVWSDDPQCDHALGSDLTNRDGSYSVQFCPPPSDQDCDDCRRVYIKIRDRDCRLIYDGCADRRCCQPGCEQIVDVALPPETLWWHLSRPVSWQSPKEALVPARVFVQIEDAIERLVAGGTPPSVAHLRIAVCIAPSIEVFDRLLDDAWATLQGDLAAAGRYRDVLRVLCATQSGGCHGRVAFADDVEAIFRDTCPERPSPARCNELKPCAEPCSCDDDSCTTCPCETPFISNEKAILLLMAALHVSCGHAETAKRSVAMLLDQLCRFEVLGSLHQASGKAILGDDASLAHVRDLLEALCAHCPPGEHRTGCPAHHPLPCCEACLDDRLAACLRQAVAAWCCIDCYCVSEVRPPRACPGEEIVIVGKGFGDTPGRVLFREKGGVGFGSVVEARDWCDDRITVVVPRGAGCGLSLLLPRQTIDVCGRFLEYRPTGCFNAEFEGTSAEILSFGVKGHTEGVCLEPGIPLHIRWQTCAADHVSIDLLDLETGSVIAALDPADPSGFWDFVATNFTSTVRLGVRITATGKCEPTTVSRQISFVVQRQPNLSVLGLEVTQAIQYFRANQHLTDPADRGLDNSLRLVTNKTAWVRTYLRSGQDPAFDGGRLDDVDGTLTVERRVGGTWGMVAVLPSQNGPISAEAVFVNYDAERGNIDSTLNFVVPAALMTGLLRFTVDVGSPYRQCPGNTASGTTQVDVNLTQTLNAAFVTVGYNGPDDTGMTTLNLPAPTLAQCQAETSWAMTTFPVSGTPNVRLAGTFTTTTPLNDPRSCDGCCSPNWTPLLQQIAILVAADQAANPGTAWVYYGIINNGIPVEVPGCSNGVATGGLAGRPGTYAHEIGHQFGLPHARCGNGGNGNASYPVYEPYDLPVDPPGTTNWTMASIGEYGLDIDNGNIANPNDVEDFMSYCGPDWISLYTHNYLVNNLALVPQVIATGSGAGSARVITGAPTGFARDETVIQPLVHILGTIDVDGNVEVASVARIETRYLRGNGKQTTYVAQLVSDDGRIIAQDNVYGYTAEGCRTGAGGDCGCCGGDEPRPVMFKAMLNDVAPGASLRIVKRGEVKWERRGAAKPPVLSRVTARPDKDGGLTLNWRLDTENKELAEVWVRWSNDDGRTWHALTVGQKGTSYAVDLAQLPSGTVRFQIIAHDGFHSVSAQSGPVQLPDKAPAATIHFPRSSSRVYAERQIHLFGSASSFAGRSIDADRAIWTIDGEIVATGFDTWVTNPGAGRHEIRLHVTDGELATTVSEVIDVPPPADAGTSPGVVHSGSGPTS